MRIQRGTVVAAGPGATRLRLVSLVLATTLAAACADADRTLPGSRAGTAAADPATTVEREPTTWTPELAAELRGMGTADQEVREGIGPEAIKDTAFLGRMARTDSAHSRRLRALVEAHGWPRTSDVGPEAADAAFLIVQHTPFEDWQRSMLPAVEETARAGELDGQSYALLYDRVQTKLGRPQKYGTQLHLTEDGRLVLDSLESPGAVDSLRAGLGMPPLQEYLKVVEEGYGMEVVR